MKKLVLIRHGETDYTREERYCGLQNIPLNASGIEEAYALRHAVAKTKVDVIYSSDLKRCTKTAKIVFGKRRIYTRKALREIDFGILSGKNYCDVKQLYPDLYRTWLTDPKAVKMPGGESLVEFAERVEQCFNEIVRLRKNKVVALVTHGGPIRVIFLSLLRMELDRFWDLEQETSALNVVSFKGGVPTVLKMNDTAHLGA